MVLSNLVAIEGVSITLKQTKQGLQHGRLMVVAVYCNSLYQALATE